MRKSLSLVAAAALAASAAFGSLARAEEASTGAARPAAAPGVVNLNTATPEELERVPGIGPALAQAIVEDRKAHGPFGSIDDLARVPGIGERSLEKLRPHVAISGKTTAQPRE